MTGYQVDSLRIGLVIIVKSVQQLLDGCAYLGKQGVCEMVKGCSGRSCHLLYFKTVVHSLVYDTEQD